MIAEILRKSWHANFNYLAYNFWIMVMSMICWRNVEWHFNKMLVKSLLESEMHFDVRDSHKFRPHSNKDRLCPFQHTWNNAKGPYLRYVCKFVFGWRKSFLDVQLVFRWYKIVLDIQRISWTSAKPFWTSKTLFERPKSFLDIQRFLNHTSDMFTKTKANVSNSDACSLLEVEDSCFKRQQDNVRYKKIAQVPKRAFHGCTTVDYEVFKMWKCRTNVSINHHFVVSRQFCLPTFPANFCQMVHQKFLSTFPLNWCF